MRIQKECIKIRVAYDSSVVTTTRRLPVCFIVVELLIGDRRRRLWRQVVNMTNNVDM